MTEHAGEVRANAARRKKLRTPDADGSRERVERARDDNPIILALIYVGDQIAAVADELRIIRERPEDEEQRARERREMGGR